MALIGLASQFGSRSVFAQPNFNPRSITHLEEANTEPREHPVDMQHMRVEVSFEPTKALVKGRVTHRFIPLREKVDSIFFDAPQITILKATLNGKPLRFTTSDAGLTVWPSPALTWGRTDSITFEYEARPRKGIYFIGWNDPKNLSRKQIWTQGQGIDNRYWIPMYDEMNDKFTTETITTFDKEYNVLSNGVKMAERDNKDGTKTWHYRMTRPHAGYLLMLGIGKYDVKTLKTKAGVPVNLWYYPEFPERFEPTYKFSTEAVDFVAEHTGIPYPWESYSQIPVQDFIFGAMENTTATVFGDFFFVDPRGFLDRNYMGVNVHELTHQWFGDYITARSGKGTWLQESFATFYPKLFFRKYFGEDFYQWQRRGEQNAAIAASEVDLFPIVHTRAGTSRVYPKGSAVLDMMMYSFGEESYRRVIQHYLKHHAYANVETSDLYRSFQDTLGITADWFFDEWLYRGGEPHYEVSYQDVGKGSSRETQISVAQIHNMNELVKAFKMPVVFEVHYADGSSDRKTEWVDKQTQMVSVPNPGAKRISYVLFDPGSNIIKKLTFKKEWPELREQALGAPNMIDRYDAVVAMRTDSVSMNTKRQTLIDLFNKESFHAIKSEVVLQLIDDMEPQTRALLRKAMKDPAIEVRSAVINNVKRIPEDLEADASMMLRDSSYNIVQTALDKLAESFPNNVQRYLDVTKNEVGMSKRVRIKWLEIKAALTNDQAAIAELVDYTSNSYEFMTRQAAMGALKKLNYADDAAVANLVDALLSTNSRLAGTAKETIDNLMQVRTHRARFLTYEQTHMWEQWQRDIIQKTIK